jgi:hypothetical protein
VSGTATQDGATQDGATQDGATREAVVIGYGFEYLVMALNCGRSIRASNPGLATTLVTNVPIEPASVSHAFDRVVVRDEPADTNRLVKTSLTYHTVADRVLYVDADSEVVGDLDPAFRLLDRFDVVLRMQAVPVNKPFELAPGIPGGVFPHLHGGVFLLRDSAPAREFLAHWQRRMVESGLSRDQPALARTVYDLPELRLVVVNAVWSADEWEAANLFTVKREPPRILHYARPHHDLAAAERLRRTLEDLLPVLPPAVRDDPDVERVREKYRRITHPLFASRLTRRPYLAAAHRLGRLRGIADVDVLDRRSVARGRPYTPDAGRLWTD